MDAQNMEIIEEKTMNGLGYKLKRMLGSVALATALFSGTVAAQVVGGAEYLIGRDRLDTIATGTYAGLANPNFGRLTLLLNHVNHYHPIGAYSYTGTPPAQSVLQTNANNRIPETFSLQPPLPLSPGTGSLYGDKLVNHADPSLDYSTLVIRSVDSLFGFAPGAPETILLNSSNGRYAQSLAGSRISLELVSISAGLTVGDVDTLNLFAGGNTYLLGSGGEVDFTPVFWTAANAAQGTYSAQFRLLDLGANGAVLSRSGTFNFDFAPVPVPIPAAGWMLASGLLWLGGRRRKA
jgi:hypothetical protein